MKGTVKFFDETKGFGFIAGEDDKEYFVHISAIKGGDTLADNEPVSFDVEQGDRGPKAANVVRGAGDESASDDDASDESEDDASDESEDDAEEKEE